MPTHTLSSPESGARPRTGPPHLSRLAKSSLLSMGLLLMLALPSVAATQDGTDTSNLLTHNQQTLRNSVNGWTPQGNTTIQHSTVVGYDDEASLQVTVDPAGPFRDTSSTARVGTSPGTDGVPVEAGNTYRSFFRVLPATAADRVRCELRWYDRGGKIVDTFTDGDFVDLAPGQWTLSECEATAPAKASYAGVRVFIDGVKWGNVYHVDDIHLNDVTSAPAPDPTPDPAPTPDPEPTPDPDPSHDYGDLPRNNLKWFPEGNAIVGDESGDGSAAVTVSRDGTFPDNTQTARLGLRPAVKVGKGSVTAQVEVIGHAPARAELRFYDADPGLSNAAHRIVKTVSGDLGEGERAVEADVPSGATWVALRVYASNAPYGTSFAVVNPALRFTAESVEADPDPPTPPSPDPAPEPDTDPDFESDVTHGVQIGAHNTGHRIPDSQLTRSGSISTTHDGQVIEGLLVNGSIHVRHSNVTIRDVKVVCPTCSVYTVYATFSERDKVNNTTIEWSTIDARGSERPGINVWGDTTMRRLHVLGASTGVRLYAGDRLIETYIEEQTLWPGSHNAGASMHGGSDVQVVRSNLIGTTSAALALYSNNAPIKDFLIEGNLFNGGSYCLNAGGGKVDRYALQNERIVIKGNQFGRLLFDTCGRFGPVMQWDPNRPGNEWHNNTWQDTGEAIVR